MQAVRPTRLQIDWDSELRRAADDGDSRAAVARRLGASEKTVERKLRLHDIALSDGRKQGRSYPSPKARKPGDVVGRLTILSVEGSERGRPLYRVKCSCGREEVVRATWLANSRNKSTLACAYCRTPECRVCGTKLSGPQPNGKRTCSVECRTVLRRIIGNRHAAATYSKRYEALRADPAAWGAHLDRSNKAYHAKVADPEQREALRRKAADNRAERERLAMVSDMFALRGALDD